MINKRNYFTTTLVMLLMAFLFQLTGASKLMLSNYEENEYSLEQDEIPYLGYEFMVDDDTDNAYITYYGKDQDFRKMLKEYCYYKRKGLHICHDFESLRLKNTGRATDMICIQGSILKEEDIPILEELVNRGQTIAFLDLPSADFILKQRKVKDILGIIEVHSRMTHLEGIHLNRGFLVGGEKYYQVLKDAGEEAQKQQDLELDVPWYVIGSGCAHYLNGIVDEEMDKSIQPGYRPAIIWSHRKGTATIYAVCGDYMKDLTGMGILSALEAKSGYYTIYPVVNAQCLVFMNYPVLSDENSDVMMGLYSRNTQNFQRELVWQGLASIVANTKFIPSYTITPYLYDENARRTDDLVSYMQLIKEQHGEVGFSFGTHDDPDGDKNFFFNELPEYKFRFAGISSDKGAIYATGLSMTHKLDGIDTLIMKSNGAEHLIDSMTGNKIGLAMVDNTSVHTFSDDLRERCILTSLGYLVLGEDFIRTIYPEEEDDQWQEKFDAIASNIETYYKDLDGFDKLSVSQAGQRARSFLNVRYSSSRSFGQIKLETNVKEGEKQYYLLRTNGTEISMITGAKYEELEEDIFLLEVTEEKVVINMKDRVLNPKDK